MTPSEIASKLGIGRASVYRVLAEQKMENTRLRDPKEAAQSQHHP